MTIEINNKNEMIMMSQYKVSIIIPCYNIESTVPDDNSFELMIESVINQSFGIENIEVIMVDDCSKDNTRNILLDLHDKYPNIKPLLLDKNGGVGNARNQAIKKASADYVMFLDQDDKYEPDFVEKAYDTIRHNDIDFMFSNYNILINNKIIKFGTGRNEKIVTNKYDSKLCYMTKFFWTGIYDRLFLLKNNINFGEIMGEDSLFISRCIISTNKNIILLNNLHGVIYTSDNNISLTHRFNLKVINEFIETWDEIIESYEKNNINEDFIISQLECSMLFLIGFVLRSNEDYETRKTMIDNVNKLFNKYSFNKVSSTWYWNLIYNWIMNKNYKLIYYSSYLLNHLFENRLFIKFFRNKV